MAQWRTHTHLHTFYTVAFYICVCLRIYIIFTVHLVLLRLMIILFGILYVGVIVVGRKLLLMIFVVVDCCCCCVILIISMCVAIFSLQPVCALCQHVCVFLQQCVAVCSQLLAGLASWPCGRGNAQLQPALCVACVWPGWVNLFCILRAPPSPCVCVCVCEDTPNLEAAPLIPF